MRKYPREYLNDVMVRLAYNSNAIEGIQLTLGQTRAVILNETVVATGIKGVKLKDLYAADNQKDAFNEMLYLVNNGAKLDIDTILKLQFELTKNTIPTAGKTKHSQLVKQWADNTTYQLDQVQNEDEILRVLMQSHVKFERMHPFDDGNGRTGRELINFELVKHQMPFLVISAEDRPFYLANLADQNIDNLVEYAKSKLKDEKKRYESYLKQDEM